MIDSLNKSSYYPEQDQCCEDVHTGVIADDLKLTSFSADEILSSDLGHVGADTRITLKRVTYSSRSISAGNQISSVHSSTVSTTRSWSGPGVVTLASNLDRHAVLGFDLLNQIPRSGDLFGWVNNLDTFIKDKHIWLQKDQVGAECACTTDTNTQQNISAEDQALNNKAGKEGDQKPAAGNCTSGSELFNIRHFASFSQMGSTK
jgi:hypothetical protein